MSLDSFFSSLDVVVLTMSSLFATIYVSIRFSLIENVGDLAAIRRGMVYNIAKEYKRNQILSFLEVIQNEGKVLMLKQERSNKPLTYSLFVFAFVSAITIAHKPIKELIPGFLGKEISLYIYTISITVSTYLLWFETKFYRAVRKIEKKYSNVDRDSLDNVLIVFDKEK